jgi:hypothetical protein
MAMVALLAGMSAAGVKYVAVVETDVDAQSGASAEINPAEVRQITAELRRQATENLPRDKYNVMTSETVQSMGGAVLEECADENCVITLGAKIGADYIVRGTISKFGTKLTLSVELYETENGTLVVSSEAVRSGNLEELLGVAAVASANMYRKFAGEKGSVQKKSKTGTEAVARKSKSGDASEKWYKNWFEPKPQYITPKYQVPLGRTQVSWGGVNFGGGTIRGGSVFTGADLNFGMDYINDSTKNLFAGFGISLGNVYDLADQLQFVYGISLGCWVMSNEGYKYDKYDAAWYTEIDFCGPFVKLRWNFVELTYRGLLGFNIIDAKQEKYDYGVWSYDYVNVRPARFNYSHQLMLGLYFVIPKRER